MKIKESEKKDKYLGLIRELNNLWNMRVVVVAIVIVAFGTVPKGSEKEVGRVENRRRNGDHSDYKIVDIGQNTQKSPGDLRRFAVTQTPIKTHKQKFA